MYKEGIIEDSTSPWRAQVLVHHGHKKRLVIDYSQTINRYTELDAYPLPLIDELVQKIADNKIYSKIDLKSAYHQVPLHVDDRKFTAFEGMEIYINFLVFRLVLLTLLPFFNVS